MSEDWRPFTLRRTIGGDVTRPGPDEWQSALRYGPKDYPFDSVLGTTITGIPVDYDKVLLTVGVPTTVTWQEATLVRGGFGYPNTPLDGEVIWYVDGHDVHSTEQFNQLVLDSPLSEGHWYYYTLFLCISDQAPPFPCEWMVGAVGQVLVPKNYHHAELLFDMIPPFYHGYDDGQAADGRHGPMRRFSALIGYDCDYTRTLLDGVLNMYHPDFSPLVFMQQVGANLGFPAESALGGARYRSLIGQLWDLEDTRGTALGLQDFIYAASNYRCTVVDGYNSMLSVDDSEFVHGIGHWQPYTNAHVVDLTNVAPVPPAPANPPLDLYKYLTLRKYADIDLSPLAQHGQGILEIIETPPKGTAGQPGSFNFPAPATLALLQSPDDGVLVSADPQYPWLTGDYVRLGDGTQAHWTGTVWAAGVGDMPPDGGTPDSSGTGNIDGLIPASAGSDHFAGGKP